MAIRHAHKPVPGTNRPMTQWHGACALGFGRVLPELAVAVSFEPRALLAVVLHPKES